MLRKFFSSKPKTPLEAYQDKLMLLLYSGLSPERVQQILLEDERIADYHAHVSGFNAEMMQAGSKLARKWGRK